MAMTPGTRIGPYELVEPLGAGGMGEVYLARDASLGRDVAVKVLPASVLQDGERLARFEREARALAALNHANIAQVYGVERSGTGPAIVMEYVPGEDLAQVLGRGALAIEDALRIARQVAAALEAAHASGIIHRDLKPANIKVRPDGVVKVLDFGLAKSADASNASGVSAMNSPTLTARATELGVILGTAAYMAPEQAKGRATDRRADVWAFGVVLYETLTGRRAFGGDDVTEVMAAVIRDTPSLDALPPGTPAAVRRLLHRCLQKDPAKRLRDMGDVGLELDEAVAGAADEAVRTAVAAAPTRPAATAIAAAVVALVAAAAVLGWWLKPVPVEDRPVTRFEALLAPRLFLSNTAFPALDISRDGRRIAYFANGSLFVRDLDQVDSREVAANVPGNEGLAISPDGRWIAKAAQNAVTKWPVGSGPSQVLASDVSALGLSWTDDGRLLLGSETGVLALSEQGGTPELLVSGGEQAQGHLLPQLLPGGRHVLYSLYAGGRWSVVVQDVEGGGPEVVLEGFSGARYVSSGHLMYGFENRLMVVPFDLASRRIRGTAITLPEGVFLASSTGVSQFAVSANGTLVLYPPGSGDEQLQLVWTDSAGAATPAFTMPRRYSDPRLSPDARRAALHVWDQDNDIWIADLQRGDLTRITFEPGEDETPVFSPDGRFVAYSSDRAGQPRTIFSKRVDGNASEPEEVLWQGPQHSHVTDWSPDGRTIIFQYSAGSTSDDILALDVSARQVTPLLQSAFSERQGRLSPDGRWLAYTSDESGRAEVFVQAYPSLDRRVTVSTGGGVEPVWSRDGRRLFFRSADDVMVASVLSTDPLELSAPTVLFPDRFVRTQGDNHIHFDAAPDGRLFFIARPESSLAEADAERRRLVIVVNWLEELKRLAPVR